MASKHRTPLEALTLIDESGNEFTPLNGFPGLSSSMVLALAEIGYLEEGRNPRYTLARSFRLSPLGRRMVKAAAADRDRE